MELNSLVDKYCLCAPDGIFEVKMVGKKNGKKKKSLPNKCPKKIGVLSPFYDNTYEITRQNCKKFDFDSMTDKEKEKYLYNLEKEKECDDLYAPQYISYEHCQTTIKSVRIISIIGLSIGLILLITPLLILVFVAFISLMGALLNGIYSFIIYQYFIDDGKQYRINRLSGKVFLFEDGSWVEKTSE